MIAPLASLAASLRLDILLRDEHGLPWFLHHASTVGVAIGGVIVGRCLVYLSGQL